MAPTSQQVKVAALAAGFDRVGICDAAPPESLPQFEAWLGKGYDGTMDYLARRAAMRADPASLLPGVRSIIAVGLSYAQPPVERQVGDPRIAMYALGRDYHKVMRGHLRKLVGALQTMAPEARFRACVDSAPILEREYAHRAGLGWFGKNTCLIDSKRGSWFFIGLLLTDLALECDAPAIGGCGTCTRCIEACPTGAIVFEEDHWQVDSRRCISYLTIEHRGAIAPELAKGIGEWTFGCDVCQEVCPFNEPRATQPERASPTTERDFRRRDWPRLEVLAEIDELTWDHLTRGSAVRRAGWEGLRRNARVNLRNRGSQ